jgi:hypothetical protein
MRAQCGNVYAMETETASIHHDCKHADLGVVRHTADLPVLRRVNLGCGCTRIEARRCDGTQVHDFAQVCDRIHG